MAGGGTGGAVEPTLVALGRFASHHDGGCGAGVGACNDGAIGVAHAGVSALEAGTNGLEPRDGMDGEDCVPDTAWGEVAPRPASPRLALQVTVDPSTGVAMTTGGGAVCKGISGMRGWSNGCCGRPAGEKLARMVGCGRCAANPSPSAPSGSGTGSPMEVSGESDGAVGANSVGLAGNAFGFRLAQHRFSKMHSFPPASLPQSRHSKGCGTDGSFRIMQAQLVAAVEIDKPKSTSRRWASADVASCSSWSSWLN